MAIVARALDGCRYRLSIAGQLPAFKRPAGGRPSSRDQLGAAMVDQVPEELRRWALYLRGKPGVGLQDLGLRYQDGDLYQEHRALANLIVTTALNSLLCLLPSDRELAHKLR